MGFTATSGSSDAITGLITLLSDPNKAVEQLQALREAQAANEKSMAEAGKALEAVKTAKGALDLERTLFVQDKQKLADELAAAESAKALAERKTVEAARAKAAVSSEKRAFDEEKVKFLAELKMKQNELEEHRRNLAQAKTDLDKKSLALNVRETELERREASAKDLVNDYTAKTAKLKNLIQ